MRYLPFLALMFLHTGPAAQELPSWTERFALSPPHASHAGVTPPSGAGLPSLLCVPEAAGEEVVRVSAPFAPGTFPEGLDLAVTGENGDITPDVRVLTWHPGQPRSVRRAMVTFPYRFSRSGEHRFTLKLVPPPASSTRLGIPEPGSPFSVITVSADSSGGHTLTVDQNGVLLKQGNMTVLDAKVIAPALTGEPVIQAEVVEAGQHYLWVRVLVPDPAWPRIIEVRRDTLGRVALRAHVQRLEPGAEHAPDLGWRIAGAAKQVSPPKAPHRFAEGEPLLLSGAGQVLHFPDAHLKLRGTVRADHEDLVYLRTEATEQTPQQLAAWREAVVVFQPVDTPLLTALLESPLHATATVTGAPDLRWAPHLHETLRRHLEDMASATLLGDDFGNVTQIPNSGPHGMNRLNHCPPIFEAARAYGGAAERGGIDTAASARLREVALLWCGNFHDLSIWWGDDTPGQFGGTRYNNRAAQGDTFASDPNFMWRSDDAVHFCTKGYDSFFHAWEETGDPRMAAALRWQVDYAGRMVHTNRGEARNIGDVLDFVRLYEFTGAREHLEHALRLFRELREKVGEDGLFSQGGEPIVADPPFIDNDAEGYGAPFAKPYIIGYALAGLPALLRHAPEEPRLLEVVRAVTHFLVESQDPVGGWRYPHPRSSRLNVGQAMEHAAQLARAAEALEAHGEDIAPVLNAIERVLQARVLGFQRSGAYFGGVDGWERSTGAVEPGASVKPLYARPEDRNPARDYTEGVIGTGGSSPEGVVYFPEVLAFYLSHRPAERLYHATPELGLVLDRMGPAPEAAPQPAPLGHGIAGSSNLSTFNEAQKARLRYPLAWDNDGPDGPHAPDFPRWRQAAREHFLTLLLSPPPRAEFLPEVVAVEDRGSYEARRLALNLSGFYRVYAYLLVPKGAGPHPAVVALHDHGAHFSIGKEKVVRPFGVAQEVLDDATNWVTQYYGGRWFGDALAERGYVVFATDALFWGERGREEGVQFDAQQAVSANLIQIGMTWPGIVTWDDVRSAEFVASLPQVDPQRIGAMGLSMGSHRTWMLSAATDHIAAGAAICWMATTEHLMVHGNNQTTGQSAYSMLVPNLRNYLDYPDVASIACPKPMLFYNGTEDALFPVPGVEAAYAKMRAVWESQGVGNALETKLWPVPHLYNLEMQEGAFAWLDNALGVP